MFRFFILLVPMFLNAVWFNPSVLDGFDQIVEKGMKELQVPGLAIGVVVDGQVVFAKGYGFRNIEKNLPVTEETLFPIGSCTKAFTTFAMAQLVDGGLVGWDQPVVDVLPGFRLWDQYATQNVTIRDLLTHRTGLPRHEFVTYNTKLSREEILKRLRYLEPSHDIRERYQYNNLMYLVAGLVMENITGKTWEALVAEQLLKPLEMKHTNFSVVDLQKTVNYASPYIEKEGAMKKMKFLNLNTIGPAGSMNSSVAELSHWVKMLLSGGVYKNQAMIKPATLQELFSPQVIVPGAPEAKDILFCSYGIGWLMASYRGKCLISHDGVSEGFTSVVSLFPNEKVGLIVLCNKNMAALPRYVSFLLIDKILGLPSIDWIEDGLASLKKNREANSLPKDVESSLRKKGTTPSHPLEDYVGEYEHPGYGKVKILLEDGKLRVIYNDLTFTLGHWHYDVFNLEESPDMIVSLEGTKVQFSNNLNGEVCEVAIPFETNVNDLIFKKKPSETHSNLNYLRQFVGVYDIYGYTVEIVLKGQRLIAIIPGQPNYELIPMGENEFGVKTMATSTVKFTLDKETGRVEEVLLVHPYGVFTAKPRKA